MKSILIAAMVIVAMSTTTASSAFAKHCPKDAKIIEQSLPKAMGLNKMQIAEVKASHAKGLALHKSGNHGESIKVLHDAIKILGVKPYKPM